MNSPLLEKISQPSDLKKLSGQQVVQLCADIREFYWKTYLRPAAIWHPIWGRGTDGRAAPRLYDAAG